MTLDEFSIVTRRIISNQGFEDFLPTACYPLRRHVQTLVDLAKDINPEEPTLTWASKAAQDGEEFLVAFKIDATHFKVIRRIGSYSEDELYSVA